MKKKILKKISSVVAGLMLFGGVAVEAAWVPQDKALLQTYAPHKILTYNVKGGPSVGWIDPGDQVTIERIEGDNWALGTYPGGNGRVRRWFKAYDLVVNYGSTSLEEKTAPQARTEVYQYPNFTSIIGYVSNNEVIYIVGSQGNARQIIYKINNGWKMGWVPVWDCWERPATQVVNNNTTSNNHDRRWVFDGSGPFKITTIYKYSNGTSHGSKYYDNKSRKYGAHGLDIAMSRGTAVYAPFAGKVVISTYDNSSGFGNYVIVERNDGLYVLFAHLDERAVNTGSIISAGQLVGRVGNTSKTHKNMGYHLHLEFSDMNPYEYYKDFVNFTFSRSGMTAK